jgi:hypothetical protein
MGIKRNKLLKEKYIAIGEQLDLLNVKVSYLYASVEYGISEALEEQSQLWLTAEDTVSTLMEANNCVVQAADLQLRMVCSYRPLPVLSIWCKA